MAHIEKCKGGAAAALIRHDERTQGEKDKHIDPALRHLNYNLCERGDSVAYMNNRIKEIMNGKTVRKDAIKAISLVVTCPQDLPEHEQKQFLQSAYNFAVREYRAENIVCAWAHFDEPGAMPHIHIKAVPAVIDKETDKEKLCAKALITRAYLKQLHPRLQQHVESEIGHPVSIINGVTAGKNKEIAELKAETALQRAAELERAIDDYNIELPMLHAKVEAKKAFLKEMETDYDLVTGVKPIKNLITGKVRAYEVPPLVWETQRISKMLQNANEEAAEHLEQLVQEFPELIKNNKALRESNRKMAHEIDKVNATLEHLHPNVQDAFFRYFNELDKPKPAPTLTHSKTAVQSLENDIDERER